MQQEGQIGARSGGARACPFGLEADVTYVNLLWIVVIIFSTLSLSPWPGGVAGAALVM
jgi:hypothetical protein